MNKYIVGIIAGLLGTIVITLLMMLKARYGLLPELDVISDFNKFIGDESKIAGWVIHFGIGAVWGFIFAVITGILPGVYWVKGVIFGILAWLLMMVTFMPIMGHGLFALDQGHMVMVAALVIHIIFGLVLGLTYGFLSESKEAI